MDINDLRSLFTVMVFVIFIGIVWWAYSGRRKHSFDLAANMVLEEDDSPAVAGAGRPGHRDN